MPTIEPFNHPDLPPGFASWIDRLRNALKRSPDMLEGDGSPEGAVTAQRKTLYYNTAGSAGSLVYIKTTDSGNTGWVNIG